MSPWRRPAWDTSWQGNPPVMTSTGSTWDQSAVVMSPRLGTSGQWWARIFDGFASNSQCQATVPPMACLTPTSRPPQPLNKEPILMRLTASRFRTGPHHHTHRPRAEPPFRGYRGRARTRHAPPTPQAQWPRGHEPRPSWPGRRARSLTASRARGHGLGPQISRRRSLWLARACARGARSLLPLSQSSGTPRQPVGGEVVWVNGTDSAIRSRDNRRGLFQCFDGSLALGGRLDLCQPSVELGSRLIVVPDMEPCDVCVAHHVGGWRVLAHGCLLIVIHRSPYPSKLDRCACQRA